MDPEIMKMIAIVAIWFSATISCKWLGVLGIFVFMFALAATLAIWR